MVANLNIVHIFKELLKDKNIGANDKWDNVQKVL